MSNDIAINDFFKPVETDDFSISSNDYHRLKPLIQFAESFSKVSSKSIYLIDYYKKGFLYVSENPLFLSGKTSKQVQQAGYLYYFKNVHEEDLELLLQINSIGFEFYKNLPLEDRMNYSITYDFRLKQPNGHYILVNHRLTPLILDNNGNMWIALCAVSPSSSLTPGNIRIKNFVENSIIEYNLVSKTWEDRKSVKFNIQEREILMLSIQGYTVEKIAQQLFLSIDTIKFHRKNIIKKMNATNISEAIFAAINQSII